MTLEVKGNEYHALKWLLLKGMEITQSNQKFQIFERLSDELETQQQVSVEPVVKPEIAITIIKTKITQLEELAKKYKDEWDIESYTDCLAQRNTLKGVLTEIEKQFSV